MKCWPPRCNSLSVHNLVIRLRLSACVGKIKLTHWNHPLKIGPTLFYEFHRTSVWYIKWSNFVRLSKSFRQRTISKICRWSDDNTSYLINGCICIQIQIFKIYYSRYLQVIFLYFNVLSVRAQNLLVDDRDPMWRERIVTEHGYEV